MSLNHSKIKALIIDDEREACDNLKNILTEYIDSDISILGIANDTISAEKLIIELNPDAVFLDIEMPDENAFQFLKRIHHYNFEIIFVTAYDEFAIRAFKLNAVDYILKPINIDELNIAIIKLKERITYRQFTKHNEYEIKALKQIVEKELPHKITLKSLNHIEVVDFKHIYLVEAQGSYCKIFFVKAGAIKEIITSNIISYYEELFPPEFFYRVHKSYIINCTYLEDIITDNNYSIVLKNKYEVPVSRRRYADFIKFLKENNFYSV
jgi:two-component system LytT family response regulator